METITEQLEKKITKEMQDKHMGAFETQSRYLGNGIYSIPGTNRYSTDTRELALMFIADREGISFKTD